ncbi:MAG: efflux RND transporter periplasmic adaptor subunit [Bacteroidales bacterium]|nr:efflux RND transporter periplasmic adaptor subunit [Bacteroidales bacterium]
MKRITHLLALLTVSIVVLYSCTSKGKTTTETKIEKPKIKVEKVYKKTVSQLYEYTAVVQAEAINNIAPTVPGRIDKIYVEIGDRVAKGQLLIQMDENNLKQAKAQLDNLELTFKRIDELYKVGGVSKAEWDAQKTNLEVTRTSYKNLKENTQLISPISGIITARNYDNGDIYAGNPLLQVQQIKPVKLLINVSEKQYTKISKGMEVKVVVDIYGDEEFNGKVSLVYPTIDPRTHTFPVEINIANANEKIRPGMYARVIVDMGSQEHVVVPDVSIVKQQGSGDRYVYVYKDGKVSYNKVKIGRRLGDSYELISGVNDGDQVAITGLARLNNGMEVEITK